MDCGFPSRLSISREGGIETHRFDDHTQMTNLIDPWLSISWCFFPHGRFPVEEALLKSLFKHATTVARLSSNRNPGRWVPIILALSLSVDIWRVQGYMVVYLKAGEGESSRWYWCLGFVVNDINSRFIGLNRVRREWCETIEPSVVTVGVCYLMPTFFVVLSGRFIDRMRRQI